MLFLFSLSYFQFTTCAEKLTSVTVRSQGCSSVFCGIEDAFTLAERLPALWAYAVGHVGGGLDSLPDGWLRLVVPGTDSNRSRWETHPVWVEVQKAFLVVTDEDEDRSAVIRARKQQANLDRGVAATVGYLSSMAAWLGRDGKAGDEADLLYMIHWLRERTPVYLGARTRKFGQEVKKKRVRFEQQRQDERKSVHVEERSKP